MTGVAPWHWILIRHPAGGFRQQWLLTMGTASHLGSECLLCTTADARLNMKLRKLHISFVSAPPTSSQETLFAWPCDLWDKSRSISPGGKFDEHLSKGCTGHLLGHLFRLRARKENCMLEEVILSYTWCHNSNIFITVAKWQDNWREKRLA